MRVLPVRKSVSGIVLMVENNEEVCLVEPLQRTVITVTNNTERQLEGSMSGLCFAYEVVNETVEKALPVRMSNSDNNSHYRYLFKSGICSDPFSRQYTVSRIVFKGEIKLC